MQDDITKQLLSRSLQKTLSRLDNKVAGALIALNQFAYYEDSIRNITLRKDKMMTAVTEYGVKKIGKKESMERY